MNQYYRDEIDLMVNQNLELVLKNSKIKNGWNGPYYDYETPLRNVSHWIVTFSIYYKQTKDIRYYNAIKILCNDYYNEIYIPDGKSCTCRIKCGKDKTNGLIGQAWVIEGLIAAAQTLSDDSYYDKAVNLFQAQRFDRKYNMWSVIETNNDDRGFDNTYNHQLWFAAAGSQILDYRYDKVIDEEIKLFLKESENLMVVHSNGLLFHYAKYYPSIRKKLWFYKVYYKANKGLKKEIPSLVYKEEGYHLFSIYAFAILYTRYEKESFFKSSKFKKILNYSFKKNFLKKLSNADRKLDNTNIGRIVDGDFNAYSYPYNSPAFEMPYIMKIFNEHYDSNTINELLNEQFRITYDKTRKGFNKNTEDKHTLNARIYELVRSFD